MAAVGGTLLGLVRHGGIIPWDVDLDLGLISSEWEKLLAISDVFTELRINIHHTITTIYILVIWIALN